jgi:uncharacterized membrane protein (DUF4010 family)
VAAGGLSVALLLFAGNLIRPDDQEPHGLTTEVAALLMFADGAYLALGHEAAAIAIGGATAIVLYLKAPLHDFVTRIGEKDVAAMMRFVLIALVILPVLPDQAIDRFGVLNPRQVWLMVVLIVGINLGGYVAYKLLGEHVGTLLAGVLGGLISSTATTVSYARRTADTPEAVGLATVVMLIATTVSYVRVLAWIGLVAPAHLPQMAAPLGVMLGVMIALSAAAWYLGHDGNSDMPEQGNPAELKTALVFGGLYALVILAVAAAKEYLGESGLYGVAILSGLHDMDAITLSTARLVDLEQLEAATAWRVVLTASLANLVTKGAIAAALGHRRLGRRIALLYGIGLVIGVVLILLWP